MFFSNDVILFSSVIQWIGVREHVQKTPIAYLLSEKKPSFLQFFSQNNPISPISDVLYVLSQKTTYSQVKRLQSYGCGATEPGRCCYYPFAKRAVPWRVVMGGWE
jgi:hypothetical protein